MEEKKYAPVIIPTLNRFDHFKQCIESLNENHDADKTEVYVSVDFPPSSDYQEGHDKICAYLDRETFRFKRLHVFKQTVNLGVSSPGRKKVSNTRFLVETIIDDGFDRWILTEDDNVFSPGFIDFMNICLEKFQEDKTVFSVCGYSFYYNLRFKDNNFYRQHADFNAWGVGYWKEKRVNLNNYTPRYLKAMVYNPKKVIKLWKVSNSQVAHLINLSKRRRFKYGDNTYTIYMIDNGMTQIMPAKSLVRNIGWDGSGIHCRGFNNDVVRRHLAQEIDTNQSFDALIGTGWEFFDENNKVIAREDFQRSSFIKTLVKYFFRLVCFWE
jgi:hypothetical protein